MSGNSSLRTVFTDGSPNFNIHFAQPYSEADYLLMAVLLKEEIVIEALLLDTQDGLPRSSDQRRTYAVRHNNRLQIQHHHNSTDLWSPSKMDGFCKSHEC
jgi:hypothetical protein